MADVLFLILVLCVVVATYAYYSLSMAIRDAIRQKPEDKPTILTQQPTVKPSDLKTGNLLYCSIGNCNLGILEVSGIAFEGVEAKNIHENEYHIYKYSQLASIPIIEAKELLIMLFEHNSISGKELDYLLKKAMEFPSLHSFQNFYHIYHNKELSLK